MGNGTKKIGMNGARNRLAGFSLIELVIVVVIIAIIGAIAIPKMSRGAAGAGDSALVADLSILRSALDLFQTENGGQYPSVGNMQLALTGYNDGTGSSSTPQATKDATHIYGPYLRTIPPLPVGASKGGTLFAAVYTAPAVAPAPSVGWIYVQATGSITSNTTAGENDAKNINYNTGY